MQRFVSQHPPKVSLSRDTSQVPSSYWRPHSFARSSIYAHAPEIPGIYGISNAREWIYIGTSDNIQLALLEHLDGGPAAVTARIPTGFSFEICTAGTLPHRHAQLVRQYTPSCNATMPEER